MTPKLCSILLCVVCGSIQAADKPNIIFIRADDLGIDGVGCYRSDKRKTPNIDNLAASGTLFETKSSGDNEAKSFAIEGTAIEK